MIYLVSVEIKNRHCLLLNRNGGNYSFMGSDSLDDSISLIDHNKRQNGGYEAYVSQTIWWMQTKPKVLMFDCWEDVKEMTEDQPFKFSSLAAHGIALNIKAEWEEMIQDLIVYEYSPVRQIE